MIEIRTFEGDAAQIAEFTTAQWRKSYEGRMPMPLWPARFMEWELDPDAPGRREYLVAAYDGTKLVGFLPAEPLRFRLGQREIPGTLGSYLSVDPEYRRQQVAFRLHDEQQRRHRARGDVWNFGYVYQGARVAMGRKFWPKSQQGMAFAARIGMWARVLDHRAVGRWELKRLEGFGAHVLGWFQRFPRVSDDASGVRAYRSDDLPRCRELVARLSEGVDLGYLWSENRLARQLQWGDLPRTLVAEEGDRIAGLVNYCVLDFLARGQVRVAVIDLMCVDELSPAGARRLLNAALCQMLEEGVALALMLRTSCYPAWPLLRAGFVPLLAEQSLIGLPMQPGETLPRIKKIHVHWR